MTEANYDTLERLAAWAQERERGLNELAEAWLLAEPAVCSVISGATSVEHVLSNAKAADWVLTDEELKEIRSILESES
jgi:aryl-alcohol dehydrogenase-like predicted oxidoreductase